MSKRRRRYDDNCNVNQDSKRHKLNNTCSDEWEFNKLGRLNNDARNKWIPCPWGMCFSGIVDIKTIWQQLIIIIIVIIFVINWHWKY